MGDVWVTQQNSDKPAAHGLIFLLGCGMISIKNNQLCARKCRAPSSRSNMNQLPDCPNCGEPYCPDCGEHYAGQVGATTRVQANKNVQIKASWYSNTTLPHAILFGTSGEGLGLQVTEYSAGVSLLHFFSAAARPSSMGVQGYAPGQPPPHDPVEDRILTLWPTPTDAYDWILKKFSFLVAWPHSSPDDLVQFLQYQSIHDALQKAAYSSQ